MHDPDLRMDMLACVSRLETQRLRAVEALNAIFSPALTILQAMADAAPPSAGSRAPGVLDDAPTTADQLSELTAQALTDGGVLLASLSDLPRVITTLRHASTPTNALKEAGDAVANVSSDASILAPQLCGRLSALHQNITDIDAALTSACTDLKSSATCVDGAKALVACGVKIGALTRQQERGFFGAIAAAAALGDSAKTAIERALLQAIRDLTSLLIDLHTVAIQQSSRLGDALADSGLAAALKLLLSQNASTLLDTTGITTDLQTEKDQLTQVVDAPTLGASLDALEAIRSKFASGDLALIRLIDRLTVLQDAILQGHLGSLFASLDEIKGRVAGYAVQTIFPNVTVTYALSADIGGLPPFFSMLDPDEDPELERFTTGVDPDQDIVLNFRMDLSPASGQARMSMTGQMQPFRVNIFDVVALDFARSTFSAGTGEDLHLTLKVAKVALGGAVDFLTALSQWLSPSGTKGFFITPKLAPPRNRSRLQHRSRDDIARRSELHPRVSWRKRRDSIRRQTGTVSQQHRAQGGPRRHMLHAVRRLCVFFARLRQ